VIHLDTSFIVDLLREQAAKRKGPARLALEELCDEPLAVSVFVICELEAGAARAARPERERERLGYLIGALPVVFPDARFAPVYGQLLARLTTGGRSIATMDLLIATAAVADQAPLLTRNQRHFEPVPGLEVRSY
jgi:tRNA(fMet)-specific endonuclease VapC